MKRKQISALLLSSTLIVSNVTPTLASAVEVPAMTVSTQETTETSTESGSLDVMQGDLSTSPETTPEVTTTPDEDVKPEVTPETDVMTEVTPENTPEVTPEATPEVKPEIEEDVILEATPEVETPVVSEEPVIEENTSVSENKTVEKTMSVFADAPEETAKPEVGTQFEVDFSNYKLICEVTGDFTADIVSVEPFMNEDRSNITISATVTYSGNEYKIKTIRDLAYLTNVKNVVISEGIEKITCRYFSLRNFDTVTLPSTLQELYLGYNMPDGTKYFDCSNWGVVNLPESNKYLRYDADYDKIFSKIEEVGPELNVGDTFKKGIFKYEVVEPGVVDMIGFLTMNDTAGEIPGTLTYKGHEYKVRDCHVEKYKSYCWNMTRLSFGEGIRNVYWGYDPNVSSDVTIQHLEYPSSLEAIDYNPHLPELKSITIPDSNAHYKAVDGILYNKSMTDLIHVPANKSMDVYAVPTSVTTIKGDAFLDNAGIRELLVPDSVKNIEAYAIAFTKGIEKITIGSGITSIGDNVTSCENLKSVVIKMNVNYPNNFVNDCPDLEEIYIEGNPSDFGFFTFTNLPSLKAYHVKDCSWLSSKDGALYSKDGAVLVSYPANKEDTLFVVPDEVKKILSQAFCNTRNLEMLVLPKGVELYWAVVKDPLKPLDVYVRDTDYIRRNNEMEYAFVSLQGGGGNVYVPNQTVLDNTNPTNMLTGMNLSVKVIPITSLTAESSEVDLLKGASTQIKTSFEPYYATEEIKWESEDTEVVSVDQNGKVIAHKAGNTKVTASVAGTSVTIQVNVKVPLESISLNKDAVTLNKGTSETLKVSYNPEDTTDSRELTWETSDADVVKVDKNGEITAVGAGEATITVKGANGVTASCEVTVKAPLTSIEIIGKKTELNRGDALDLDVKYNPEDTTDSKEIAWSVSDNHVLTVDSAGRVTAKGVGTAIVYAKGANNVMDSFEITVKAPLEQISLDKAEMTLTEGTSSKLLVNYNPTDTTDDKTVTWISSDNTVVSVDVNGNVTAHKPGTATITAKVGNKEATCKVTVTNKEIALDNIEITTPNVSLEEEETVKLDVVYNPTDTTVDRTVDWTSSDTSVASVDKTGNVTAHKAGTVIITAKVGDKTATCTVKVNKKEIALESIAMNQTAMHLKADTQGKLNVIYNPTNTTVDKTVTWTSSDKSVASVDADGNVTAHKAGSAIITAKVGDKVVTCVVTVTKDEVALESISLNLSELNLKVNSSELLKVNYNPTNTTVDRTVAWTSSDASVVSVDANGNVTAHKAGTAIITAKVGDKTTTCTVTVVKEEIALENIDLNQNTMELKVNGSGKLEVSYNPTNTTVDRTVTWTSSDASVVSVDADGNVTAHKAGTATITAMVGNKTVKCVITVLGDKAPEDGNVDSITDDKTDNTTDNKTDDQTDDTTDNTTDNNTEDNKNADDKAKPAKTSDPSAVGMFGTAFALSGGVLAKFWNKRRKKK